jgi:hypothetical protein
MTVLGNTPFSSAASRNNSLLLRAIRVPSFPENGTLNSLTARISDSGADTWQAGVWDSTGTLLYSSAVRTDITGTAGSPDEVFTFAGESLNSGTEYLFGVVSNAASGALAWYANGSQTYDGYGGSAATSCNPLQNLTPSADATRDYSISIDYTAAGGSIAPLAMNYQRMLRNA